MKQNYCRLCYQYPILDMSVYSHFFPSSPFLLADDKTCNHTFHCIIGNYFLKKAIQVMLELESFYLDFSNKSVNAQCNFSILFCSQKIKLSLFLLLIGVGIASITDLQLNFVGTVLSVLAIITTCVGQIVSFCFQHFLVQQHSIY